jgi:hypothetical protein
LEDYERLHEKPVSLIGGEMKEHQLKTWQPWFNDTVAGKKKFEFRKDDRGFEVGDTLILRGYDPHSEKYVGGFWSFKVTYILRDAPGLPKDYCIMGIEELR